MRIKENVEERLEIKKSIFISNLIKVNNEDEAKEKIAEISKKYNDATHNTYAIIINDSLMRSNDDGEPSGCAGKPILEALKQNHLEHVLCVVTRYFGGIKLGANGLITAYKDATMEAIKKAKLVENIEYQKLRLDLQYQEYNNLMFELNKHQILDTSFFEHITVIIGVKKSALEDFVLLLCAKRINYSLLDTYFFEE